MATVRERAKQAWEEREILRKSIEKDTENQIAKKIANFFAIEIADIEISNYSNLLKGYLAVIENDLAVVAKTTDKEVGHNYTIVNKIELYTYNKDHSLTKFHNLEQLGEILSLPDAPEPPF